MKFGHFYHYFENRSELTDRGHNQINKFVKISKYFSNVPTQTLGVFTKFYVGYAMHGQNNNKEHIDGWLITWRGLNLT